MATFPLFRGAAGLNNVVEPHRLTYREDGFCDMAEAVNVIIDDSGSVRRRYGVMQKVPGPCHSLWSWGAYCFFVSEGALMRYMPDGTTLVVHNSAGDMPMHYAAFGGKVYCSNGVFRAILDDMSISSWDASVPVQFKSDGRTLGMPPTFTKILVHAGRMYAVDGCYLWESEPFNPCCFDLGGGFLDMAVPITDAVSVRGGIYVSIAHEVLFLAGASSRDFVSLIAHNSPMVPGTARLIEGSDLGNGDMVQGLPAVWVSKNGVCVGQEDGRVLNMTSRKLVFDNAVAGAGAVLPGQYFFSLEV